MPDAEYDAGGNAIQRPAVVPPVLSPLDANAMLRDGFAHHEAWVTVRAKLLAAVIKSVLPHDLMHGFARSPTRFFAPHPPSPSYFLLTSRRYMGR
jgi:hypothetical protein